jgi:alpha/beta superfamily hydrolase
MLREFPGPSGRLEALLEEPEPPAHTPAGEAARTPVRAAVVLAHPHPQWGGTMHSKVVYASAKALTRIGCSVLRFNFRGTGLSQGVFDNGVGERDDFRAALDVMRQRYPGASLWAAGMSFGAWVGLTAGAADPGVTALIGIAIPLSRDFAPVRDSPKAKFFVHGERDEVSSLSGVRAFYAAASEPKELVVIDAADHTFDGQQSRVGDALEDLLGDWNG